MLICSCEYSGEECYLSGVTHARIIIPFHLSDDLSRAVKGVSTLATCSPFRRGGGCPQTIELLAWIMLLCKNGNLYSTSIENCDFHLLVHPPAGLVIPSSSFPLPPFSFPRDICLLVLTHFTLIRPMPSHDRHRPIAHGYVCSYGWAQIASSSTPTQMMVPRFQWRFSTALEDVAIRRGTQPSTACVAQVRLPFAPSF